MITGKEVHKAGFEIYSKAIAWELFAANADTVLVVTSVPLTSGKTYLHVMATSNAEDSAKKWAGEITTRIRESKIVSID